MLTHSNNKKKDLYIDMLSGFDSVYTIKEKEKLHFITYRWLSINIQQHCQFNISLLEVVDLEVIDFVAQVLITVTSIQDKPYWFFIC